MFSALLFDDFSQKSCLMLFQSSSVTDTTPIYTKKAKKILQYCIDTLKTEKVKFGTKVIHDC